jgi:hypothetical protein
MLHNCIYDLCNFRDVDLVKMLYRFLNPLATVCC